MAGRACNDCLGVSEFNWFGGIAACGLNRFGHIQIFMVAIYAKLQRIFEMAIGYAVKHNRLPLKSLLFYSVDTMLSEEGVEVGAVDVDFATYLREGDEALVSVVLPCLGRDTEELAGGFGFYPFAAGVIGIAPGDEANDLLQRGMEVAPFFFRHYEQQCRWGDILRCTLHSGVRFLIPSTKKIESG